MGTRLIRTDKTEQSIGKTMIALNAAAPAIFVNTGILRAAFASSATEAGTTSRTGRK